MSPISMTGRKILIVDDLVDTGATAKVVRRDAQGPFRRRLRQTLGAARWSTPFITEVSQDTWIYFPWDMGLSPSSRLSPTTKGGWRASVNVPRRPQSAKPRVKQTMPRWPAAKVRVARGRRSVVAGKLAASEGCRPIRPIRLLGVVEELGGPDQLR